MKNTLGTPNPVGPKAPAVTGTPITPGEIITMLMLREETRDDVVGLLAETLAELGISGEEIAHWQKQPGTCIDDDEIDQRMQDEWREKAKTFSTAPIEMWREYLAIDVP